MNDDIKNEHDLETEEETPKKAKAKRLTKEQRLAQEIAELKEEVAKWKNEYYKVHADMANARKQDAKDKQAFIKYRAVEFIEKILPVVDIFNKVLSVEVKDEVLKNYLTGFSFVHRQLIEALTSEGVTEIAVKEGEMFNGDYMYALEQQYDPDLKQNTVISVHNNCYKLHDRIVRPAMVVVSTNIKKEDEQQEEIKPEDMN